MANEDVLQSGLFEFLSAAEDLKSRVGDRIYPTELPRPAVFPAMVFNEIAGVTGHDLAGRSGLDRHRVQIDCYAKTWDEAKGLARAVEDVLDSYDGPMGGSSRVVARHLSTQMLKDQETDLFRGLTDWHLWEHVP